MHKELIGQEASLSLPCTANATPLLLGFIEELMEVSGSETSDPERLGEELNKALGVLCAALDADPECNIVVVFDIRQDSVEVRLSCEDGESPEPGAAEHVVTAHEA